MSQKVLNSLDSCSVLIVVQIPFFLGSPPQPPTSRAIGLLVTYMYMYMYTCIFVCVHIYIYIYLYTYIHTHIYICVCGCLCVYMHISSFDNVIFFHIFTGGWVSSIRLKDIPESRQPNVSSFPAGVQKKAAAKTFDSTHAISELFKRRQQPEIAAILKQATGATMLGASQKDFPGLRLLLAALAHRNLATDKNLEMLFGDAMYVRAVMLKVGQIVAMASQISEHDPMFVHWRNVIVPGGFSKLVMTCAECETSLPSVSRAVCCEVCASSGGCFCAMYCSEKCRSLH